MRTKKVQLLVEQLVPFGLVMVVKATERVPEAVSLAAWVRLAQRTLALAVQLLAPVASTVKLVLFVQLPLTVPPPAEEKLSPAGAVQVPIGVVQAWNFSPWIAAAVPGT